MNVNRRVVNEPFHAILITDEPILVGPISLIRAHVDLFSFDMLDSGQLFVDIRSQILVFLVQLIQQISVKAFLAALSLSSVHCLRNVFFQEMMRVLYQLRWVVDEPTGDILVFL